MGAALSADIASDAGGATKKTPKNVTGIAKILKSPK
jgi:hypothetical protein